MMSIIQLNKSKRGLPEEGGAVTCTREKHPLVENEKEEEEEKGQRSQEMQHSQKREQNTMMNK
jgi:hypothetical protein